MRCKVIDSENIVVVAVKTGDSQDGDVKWFKIVVDTALVCIREVC